MRESSTRFILKAPTLRQRLVGVVLTFVVAAVLIPCGSARGQGSRLVPLDHWSYEYILRLQRRGHLLELHPTALPYTYGEVRSSLEDLNARRLSRRERTWARRLAAEFGRPERRRNARRGPIVGGALQPGIRVSSHDRLDPLRYLDGEDVTLEAAGLNLYPNVAGQIFLMHGPLVAQAGLRFDVYYRDDPDGLNASNRLIVRNEDVYAGYGSRYVSIYLGRFRHHWAPPGADALLLSENPVGVDHLNLRLGGRRLALRSILGELDSITSDGRYTGAAGADSVAGSIRRFLAAHRFDWRPSRSFALSLMESTLYSSESSGISLKFLNPLNLHAFAVDGRPKNDENNGLLTGMLWLQYRRLTVQGQLLLDDFDLLGESGEAPSAALSGTLTYAGWPAVDLGGSLTAVTARAYNTHQPEGRYLYLLRGIGTQFNDYVELSGFAAFYRNWGDVDVKLKPKLDLLWQGERDIRQRYPIPEEGVDAILTGDVSRTVRPAVEVRLQGSRMWWMTVDVGPIFTDRPDVDDQFTLFMSINARFDILDRVDLSF